MQLDKIIITLRQRTTWEAMDLGVKLMRHLWPVLFYPWLILICLVLAFVIAAELQGHLLIAIIFMWWIKPVYDSLILHVISRGVFGEYVKTADVYTSIWVWLKSGLINTVFIWRFSPSRSYNLPVYQLEGLSGAERKNRLKVLHRMSNTNAMAVTLIGLLFELLIALTTYTLVIYFAPETSMELFEFIAKLPDANIIWFVMGSIIYAITLFVLEPFYVASGFMLYLNRRTQLEGWDIELDFKKLAQRIEDSQQVMLRDSSNV